MIELQQVHKTFTTAQGNQHVLKGIDLEVAAGTIWGIVGASGAGKSTLIRCVNLLEQPCSGQVIVNGQALQTLSTAALRHARQRIGMIFQHFNLVRHLTVTENIALPLTLCGATRGSVQQAVLPLLDLIQLQNKARCYPHQLSGGEKQRVAIARALVMQPKVLLADEATSALDPQNTHLILKLLRDINQQFKLTILLISHEMDVIKQTCHHVGVLEQGQLVERGDIATVFKKPQSAAAKRLILASLHVELPAYLQQGIQTQPGPDSYPLWRIWFNGPASAEPQIANMIKQFAITVNIHQANIDFIGQEATGIMIASLRGNTDAIAACLAFLQQHGNEVETIGYVTDHTFLDIHTTI